MELIAQVVLTVLGGGAGAYAVIRFLSESLIRHRLDKAAQTHAAQLTQQTERLKTEFSIYAHEQNIALARVDAQGARALHEIDAAIRAWVRPAARLLSGSPLRNSSDDDHLKFYAATCEEMHAAAKKLLETLGDNAIYVDTDLYATIGGLAGDCAAAGAKTLVPLRRGPAEHWPVNKITQEFEACRHAFIEEHEAKLLPVIQSLTERFRATLGTLRARARTLA